MKYDDIISYIGQFGRYQKRCYALLCLPAISIAIHTISSVFILALPDHRCAIPDWPNDTFATQSVAHAQAINGSIPLDGDGSFKECHYRASPLGYSVQMNTTNGAGVTGYGLNISGDKGTEGLLECDRWVYDTSVFESSIMTMLDLVCEKKLSRSHAQMFFMLGSLCGALFLGPPADLLGRKKIMMLSIFLHIMASFAIAFTSSLIYLYAFVFLNGASVTALYIIVFVIGMELVGPDKRRFTGFIIVIFFGLGVVSLSGVAYFIRDWKTLQLVLASLPVPFITYFWFVPESPRWLITRGRFADAENILRRAAKVNQRDLPDKALAWDKFETDVAAQEPMWRIVTYPRLVVRTFIVFINWMVCSMTYYGLGLNVGDLAGSIYLNSVLYGSVEILSYIFCMLLLDRVGRRRLHLVCMFAAGIACTASPFPLLYGGTDWQWLTITLATVGKFGVSGAFAIIWVYSSEIFPTVIRNSGVSISSMCARVGGVISPYIANLSITVGGDLGKLLPLVIFGGMSLLAGLMALWLPETRRLKLPDTLKEANDFGRTKPAAREVEVELLRPGQEDASNRTGKV